MPLGTEKSAILGAAGGADGGNYFGDYLGKTRGIICWDKVQPFPNFSAWEFAWTSFNKVAKLFVSKIIVTIIKIIVTIIKNVK